MADRRRASTLDAHDPAGRCTTAMRWWRPGGGD